MVQNVCWNESDLCVISGFCHEAGENCALLDYHSASSGVLNNDIYSFWKCHIISNFLLLFGHLLYNCIPLFTTISITNLEIRKRKFRWIGHTLRKDDGEIPKAALLWNPQGNRKRGRLRNSWRRSVIKETGRSWNELRFLAADRQKWKGLINNLCS